MVQKKKEKSHAYKKTPWGVRSVDLECIRREILVVEYQVVAEPALVYMRSDWYVSTYTYEQTLAAILEQTTCGHSCAVGFAVR